MLRSNSDGGAFGVGIYLSTDKVFDSRDVAHLVTCANARPAARLTGSARFLLAPTLVLALSLVVALALPAPARAQGPISAADLTGTWAIAQIATPTVPFTPTAVRSYSGTVTLAAGVATSGALIDDLGDPFTITGGTLTVTSGGVVGGSLTLDDGLATPNLSLDVAEARLLLTRHAIIGVSTILSNPGFFTMVRREPGQTFTIPADLAADWSYHELTPSNAITPLPPAAADDASWVRGTITFHQMPAAPDGCSEADLTLADGTIRAQRNGDPQSFGCATLGAGGVGNENAVAGTNASFVTRLTTDATGTSANRDLILGLTDDPAVGAPGLVLLSRMTPSPPAGFFAQTDLAGPWRVYLHRVESARQGSTWQAGTTTFTGAGAFSGGVLEDINSTPTTLTTGSLLVSTNGSVAGTLSVNATALADQYAIKGVLRATKDVITGVVTARVNARTQTFYGLLTMVREATVFDLGQGTYTVTEGGTATITVLRSGNRAGASTVHYDATGGTAPLADYQAAGGTLTFLPNAASATFVVKTNANTLVDGNRSVNLVLSAPTGAGALLGATASGVLNIVDEDKAGTVKLSQAAYAVSEAGKSVPIVIQRSGGTASAVVVQFATADGTATAGVDYTATSGSVTFGANETTKTVAVPIAETAIVDGSRTFTFTLTGATPPSTVVGTPASAVVTIGDNDVAGTVQFKFATYTVDEAAGSAAITVTRTGGSAGGVLVSFSTADGTATAPADYATTAGTLTFLQGNTSATFSIPIVNDALVEGDETVLLTLSNPQGGASLGAQKTAVLTIKDGQKGVQFSAATYTATESAVSATVTISRTGPMPDTATVRYSTSDGTARAGVNYKPTSGTLTFAPNINKATFTVPLLPDKQVKGPQTVLLLLSNPTATSLGPLSSAVLTLGDVDVAGTVKLASATFAISEAAGSAVISVSRSGGTAGGVTVDFATADQPCGSPPCPGKAQAGFDYQAVSGTLTFAASETTKTILIPVSNDDQVNGNRAFNFTLSNPQGGGALAAPTSAVVTIVDDDKGGVIQFGAATFTANEPAIVTPTAVPITITRTGTNLAGGATAAFSTANGTATAGTDYVATATTVVFGQGETSKSVPVPLLFDGTVDGNKTVLLSLTTPGGGATLGSPTSAVLTIVDSTASTRLSAASYAVNEGGVAAITVLRGGPTNGTVKVAYATSDLDAVVGVDYKNTAGTLTFNPGVGALTFTVPTFKIAGDTGSRSFSVSLSPVGGGSPVTSPSTAVVTIADVDPPGTFQFGAATYSATEGGAAPTVTVTRTDGSGGSVVVRWTVNTGASTATSPPAAGADYGPATTGTLTFGPGVSSLKLPLTIVNDTLAEDPETVVITLALEAPVPAGAVLGSTTTTTLTIVDNDNGGTIQFAATAQTVAESISGGKTSLIVTRTGGSLASGILVDYTATGDTSAVTLPSGTLTFVAGQTSATIPVTLVTNALPEPDRNVTITLSNARSSGGATGANAPALGATSGTALKIVDDEPRVQFAAANLVVTEGGTATITVTRTGATGGGVTVDYATGGGTAVANTHYTPASGTLTFGAGVLSRTFTVTTIDDGVAAGNRTVGLTLSGAVNASLGATNPATLTIQDKESAGTFQFAAATGTVVEGLGGDPGRTLHVTVTRTGANLVGPVTIGWSATGGTAAAGAEFSPGADFSPGAGMLTFDAGVASQSFDITAFDDGVAEGTETIVLGLAPPSAGTLGSPSAMTIFIIDAQQSVAFSSPTFTVGETTPQAVITVMRIGVPTGPVTVTATTVPAAVPVPLQAVPGSDYQNVTAQLSFAPGEIVKTFNVPIITSNALINNGNRIVGLQLVDPPVNAALVGNSTAQLTILDFRPDLVVASVASPSSGIAGKTLPTPTTVKNLGQVASPAFRVGIFMAKDNGSPDDGLPGAGSLVMQRDVPSLAAGATTALPTQLAISDDAPAGNYFVSAVANFNQTVTEADSTNNGLSSAPAVLKVSSNLSKFQSASASFSLGNASSLVTPSRFEGIGRPLVNPCDVSGSVNLSGSFTITSQQQDTATGIADLSGILTGGPLDGQPVRFVVGFTGTADASNNITASLTSIVVTGAFSATGGPPTTPAGTFTGSLTGSALSGSASGSFHTAGGGDCAFSGPLTAAAQTSFGFRFATRVPVGFFGFTSTPTINPPVNPSGYLARFKVLFDSNFPDPSAVRFTGPAGSGFTGTPADPSASHGDDTGSNFTYRSPVHSGIAPGGTWSVLYKGLLRTFTVPTFDANRSFVVIVPSVTLDTNRNLTQVNWSYQDAAGNRLTGPPPFLGGLRLRIDMNGGGNSQPQSPDLPPTVTSFNFAAAGISPPEWSQVNAVVFQYVDLLGNEFELDYQQAFAAQVNARLENVYQASQPLGIKQRLLNVAVNVPFNSVDVTPCNQQVTGGFLVSVQNQSPVPRIIPYDSATCMDRTGTILFPGAIEPVDIFSRSDNLDALGLPTLPIGAVFEFDVTVQTPVGLPVQQIVTSLMNAEANPSTDYIDIPNPATPTQRPTGFKLSDARLGQNLTVSWKPPAFEIGSIQISSNAIVDPPSGQGPIQAPAFTLPPITCGQPSIDLPTNATSATFKIPATCLGAAATRAQFCIFIVSTSDADNKTSAACWFFQ